MAKVLKPTGDKKSEARIGVRELPTLWPRTVQHQFTPTALRGIIKFEKVLR